MLSVCSSRAAGAGLLMTASRPNRRTTRGWNCGPDVPPVRAADGLSEGPSCFAAFARVAAGGCYSHLPGVLAGDQQPASVDVPVQWIRCTNTVAEVGQPVVAAPVIVSLPVAVRYAVVEQVIRQDLVTFAAYLPGH